ncbi:MAG: hypothetical protein IPL40_08305 [Proteobacteria bacterium]|nr:hypothetical protein [Pseudomonadota bacterium]
MAVLDRRGVTACLEVDFGGIEARAAAVGDSSMPDTLCGDTCSGSYCGTNPGALVFASADQRSWKRLGDLALSTTPTAATLPSREPWR